MDERDMEEEGKNREGKRWGTGTKMFFFLIKALNSYAINI
jgi:hypothetical protein